MPKLRDKSLPSRGPAGPRRVNGEFVRDPSTLRNWVTVDGRPGPSGRGGYPAEAGRYHLYIAEGCPWAHRTWIMHRLKSLTGVVGLSCVADMSRHGWAFDPTSPDYRDRLGGRRYLHQVYDDGAPGYRGRITVPVLFDSRTETIVSNESADIIRMFNSAFDAITGNRDDYYPAALADEIDRLNQRIYRDLNNGVYRAGFAGTDQAHQRARADVFAALDDLEALLAQRRYLTGDRITEADWRLFPTLVRFDAAYYSAFRCNQRRLIDYPRLWAYTRDLYRQPGIGDTVVPAVYRRGYHSIPFAVGHGDQPTQALVSLQ